MTSISLSRILADGWCRHKSGDAGLLAWRGRSPQIERYLIVAFDKQVSELRYLGRIHRTILLGPVALTRGYGVGGPSTSGEVVQAALASDGGAAATSQTCEVFAFQNLGQKATVFVTTLLECCFSTLINEPAAYKRTGDVCWRVRI